MAVNKRKIFGKTPMVIPLQPTGNTPRCTVLPVITGTVGLANILTVSQGTWLNNPGTFLYQWQRNSADIPGAVFTSYTCVNADLGQVITCVVTAWNNWGNGVAKALPAGSGGGGGGGTLSAPVLGFPSPINSTPSSLIISIGIDWQVPDVLKVAYSSSPTMSSPTILTHVLQDSDLSGNSISLPLPSFAGLTYLQAYGSHSGADSVNKSNVVAWGDTVAPTITTSGTQSNTETLPLAVVLSATDTGGVPNTISDGTLAGWYISGGADQLLFQIVLVSGIPTLQWLNNGTQSHSTPLDQTLNNTYNVTVGAIDYSGNQSTLAVTTTVAAADLTPDAFSWTNQSNVPLSTLEVASNTWTVSGLSTGVNAPLSATGNIRVSTDSGVTWTAWGSPPLTVQNGHQIQAEVTSSASFETPVTNAVTVGTLTATFTVTTQADPANVSWVPETPPAGQNIAFGANSATFNNVNFGVGMGLVFTASSDRQITGVTVGGSSATLVSECSATGRHVAIWRINITSGGLKTVVISNGSFALKYVAIASGTMTPTSQTPSSVATPKAYGFTPDPQALASITVPTNGIALCAFTSESPDNTPTWNTGIPEADVVEDTTANGGLVLLTAHLRTTGAFSVSGFNNAGSGMVAAAWAK